MKIFTSERLFLGVFLLLASVILSGCVPSVSGPSGVQKAGKYVFVKGAVASGFPPIPLYPKAQIIESYSTDNNFGVSAYSTDTLDEVVEFYRQTFIQNGWENNLARQGEDSFIFEFKSPEHRGDIIINNTTNKSTAITITAAKR